MEPNWPLNQWWKTTLLILDDWTNPTSRQSSVPFPNRSDLQQGIQRHAGLEVLDNDIIDRNRHAVAEQFSLSSYADRTLKIYQELLDTEDTTGCPIRQRAITA